MLKMLQWKTLDVGQCIIMKQTNPEDTKLTLTMCKSFVRFVLNSLCIQQNYNESNYRHFARLYKRSPNEVYE